MPNPRRAAPVLAYVETSLPATTTAGRLALAAAHGLALEVVNPGGLDPRPYLTARVPVASVQAYALHDSYPLHPDPARRAAAARHVEETLEIAARLGAPRIVTACAFGRRVADRSHERCLEFFASRAPRARELGVRILIEPLSPRRAAAMNEPWGVARLLDALGDPEVFGMVLDTGHLADAGHDLDAFFRAWRRPVEEVQLKARESRPPPPDWPVADWIAALPEPPPVLCVEHRKPISYGDFRALVAVCESS